jgi:hypothetical protein
VTGKSPICRTVCTTPAGHPAFVRVRVWESPAHFGEAHAAALGILACNSDMCLAELRISIVSAREAAPPPAPPATAFSDDAPAFAPVSADRRVTRVLICLTVAVYETPELADATLEEKCEARKQEALGRLIGVLRAHDPPNFQSESGTVLRCGNARWQIVPDDVLVTPLATPYR